jgi:integrase
MSTPELKKHDNGVWYVWWTDGRRSKRVSTRTKDLAAAKAFLGQWLLMEQSETVSHAQITCGDAWDLYFNEKLTKRGHDTRGAETRWRLYLKDVFAHRPIVSVTQRELDTYVKSRTADGAAKGTVWLEMSFIRASWNFAVRKRVIASDKLPDVEWPEQAKPRDHWLRQDEIAKLLDAAAMDRGDRLTRVERFLWIGLETAARRAAIERLKWEHIDFDTGVINYAAQGSRGKKRKVAVAISDRLLPVLRRAYDERVSAWVLDAPTEIWHAVNRLGTRVGVKVSPHVLRHTAATHMMRNGVDIWLVAQVLGDTVETVEKVYGHHMPEASRPAVNAISGGRFRVVG